MNGSWGVYEVCGRLPGGKETAASDRQATRYFIRWRVNGRMRRRTFETKAHARQWRETLIAAKNLGWAADEKGWPVSPNTVAVREASPAEVVRDEPVRLPVAHTVETYVNEVWWPGVAGGLGDKSRLGHRRNADLIVQLMRVKDGDPRTASAGVGVGSSLPLAWWTPDDTKAAIATRRGINGRTAAKNDRRVAEALRSGTQHPVDVTLQPEVAGAATVRNFWLTLGMIARSAVAAGHVGCDPIADTAAHAPKPRASKRSDRLVPTLDELFDLADAIGQMGPLMRDGRPAGTRFRSLVLCAGTTGPRPGELVAHQPSWFDWESSPPEIRFQATEAAVYGAILGSGENGRRVRPLKHQPVGEYRTVPLICEVEAALGEHFERGYSSPERTWLSPTGRGHVDFGNLTDVYWRPALRRVFAATAKASLVNAAPKLLRKTAITWWADSGISQPQAAEWAGHSEEVARVYYASRASMSYAREAALLQAARTPVRRL